MLTAGYLNSSLPVSPQFPYRAALETAIEMAVKAGDLLLEIHRAGPRQVGAKSTAIDIVTEADGASQALILETIGSRFPDHGVVAEEEGGDKEPGGQAVWYIDPLDGTTNFASRYPVFSVSIALWVAGAPVVGVVQDVVRQYTYWAAAGQGAWLGTARRLDETRLRVSHTAELNHSLVATGFPYSRATNPDNNLAEFGYLMPRLRGVRRAGSAAMDVAWAAEGRVDGYWEAGPWPWDWAAAVLLLTEAGGVVTDYAGDPWRPESRCMVAANPLLHPKLLAAVQTARHEAGLPLVY